MLFQNISGIQRLTLAYTCNLGLERCNYQITANVCTMVELITINMISLLISTK